MIKLEFTKAKETKGTWQFQEVNEGGERPIVGSLYMTKDALKAQGWPQKLTVTIEGQAS